jgi:hypothetical protein
LKREASIVRLSFYTCSQNIDFDYDALFTTAAGQSIYFADLDQSGNYGLAVNPVFMDPYQDHFSLAPDSPLADAVDAIPGINDVGPATFTGTVPDIGGLEYSK